MLSLQVTISNNPSVAPQLKINPTNVESDADFHSRKKVVLLILTDEDYLTFTECALKLSTPEEFKDLLKTSQWMHKCNF